jgi:hypothetical protein
LQSSSQKTSKKPPYQLRKKELKTMRETKKQDAKIQEAKMQGNVNKKPGSETLIHHVAGAAESGKLRSLWISTHNEDIKSVPHRYEIRADSLQGDVTVNNPSGFPGQVQLVSNSPPGHIKKIKPVVSTPAAPFMN